MDHRYFIGYHFTGPEGSGDGNVREYTPLTRGRNTVLTPEHLADLKDTLTQDLADSGFRYASVCITSIFKYESTEDSAN